MEQAYYKCVNACYSQTRCKNIKNHASIHIFKIISLPDNKQTQHVFIKYFH